MSEPYQIYVFIPQGLPAKQVVYGVHDLLERFAGNLDEDSFLYLNETTTVEPEPEVITNQKMALETLAAWPTLGSLDYALPEGMTNVAYEGQPFTQMVQVVVISLLERAFERGGAESKRRYVKLAQELHTRFQAKRTIMDWGIWARGLCWKEEIDRLQNGKFQGQYALVDLKDG